MNIFLVGLFTLSVLVDAVPAAEADAAVKETPRKPVADVTVELRCVTLPQDVAIPLIRKFRSTDSIEKSDAATEAEQLIAKGVAKLVAWPFVTTHDHSKASSEAGQEIHYAAGFDPGKNSVYVSDNDGQLRKDPPPAVVSDFEPLPASFATRKVGATFEVEPVVSEDGKSVDLSLEAHDVRLQSVDRITVEHEHTTEKKIEKITVEQPRFSDATVRTALTMENGEQRLIGIFKVPGEERLVELFILGAEIHGKK